MNVSPIRIIGIDPGLRNLGWGIVDSEGTRLSFVACGAIHSTAGEPLSERLRQLHDGLAAVLREHLPMEAAVEGVQDRLVKDGIALELAADAEIGGFVADEWRLRQVLFNLLSNAVGFSPKG